MLPWASLPGQEVAGSTLPAMSLSADSVELDDEEALVRDTSWRGPDDALVESMAKEMAALPQHVESVADLLPRCAHPERSAINLPGGYSTQMLRAIDLLDSVLLFGQGRVSIVHIGGSHVQADTYTAVVRHRLDSLNNGLRPPRGLLFPFAAAKTNNPVGYRTRYGGHWDRARCSINRARPPLGVAGIEVSTTDPNAWIDIDMNPVSRNKEQGTGNTEGVAGDRAPGAGDRAPGLPGARWTATALTLLGRTEVGRYQPTIVVEPNNHATPVEVKGTPCAVGWRYSLPWPVERFRLVIRHGKPGPDVLHVGGFVPDNEEGGIVYHTIGVNGASVPSYLGCERFEAELAELHPDVAIFGIGINDAIRSDFTLERFAGNYGRLLSTFRSVNPECAFIFLTNNDSCVRRKRRRVVNQNGPKQQAAFLHIAEQWQGGLWDLYDVMGGLGSMAQWQRLGLAQKDKVHFTRAGYILIGNLFMDALLDFYLSTDPI